MSSMTKKNFVAIAEAIAKEKEMAQRNTNGAVRLDTLLNTANRMADVCKDFNQNFDRARFLAACGF